MRWDKVHAARERHVLGRLDLLDARGHTLIRIRGCIDDFDRLSRLIKFRLQQAAAQIHE